MSDIRGLNVAYLIALSVYWYYFTSVLYHLSMGLMEGIGLAKTIQRVKDNFWKTATSAWIYW